MSSITQDELRKISEKLLLSLAGRRATALVQTSHILTGVAQFGSRFRFSPVIASVLYLSVRLYLR